MTTVILIGPPGSGKSATAEILACELKCSVVDTDRTIVAEAGLTVGEIFSTYGEEHFRELETSLLERLVETRDDRTGLVVSCGGGLPVRERNYQLLDLLGTVVCLYATAECLCRRVLEDQTRPLLQSDSDEKTMERIKLLLSQRAPTYGRPRYRIDTTELSPARVSQQIISLLGLV